MAMPQTMELPDPSPVLELIPADSCTSCGAPTTPDQHSVCQPCWENAIRAWKREHAGVA